MISVKNVALSVKGKSYRLTLADAKTYGVMRVSDGEQIGQFVVDHDANGMLIAWTGGRDASLTALIAELALSRRLVPFDA